VPINIIINKVDRLEIDELIIVKDKITKLMNNYNNIMPIFIEKKEYI
jgi:hypothetical protein